MSIIIGADFVPTASNLSLFNDGSAERLLGEELMHVFMKADYRIINLEIPFSEHNTPIKKCGPTLSAPMSAISVYKTLGIDLVTIANNHIYDQGEAGLQNTLDLLYANGISYVGAGMNLRDARKSFVFLFEGKRIGVYACTEHEFSAATEKTGGANLFDPLFSLDHIQELKAKTDYVIVLYHGGKEHYRYPSPYLQMVCRRMVDKGADLVLCQHSHCIGCEERYKNGVIIYGQGNFLFDYKNEESWNTGLLININKAFEVKYIPIIKQDNCVRAASMKDKEQIMQAFFERSQEIQKSGMIEQKYATFIEEVGDQVFQIIEGQDSFLFRSVNRLMNNKLRLLRRRKRYNNVALLKLLNRIECETWRELVIHYIKKKVFPYE